MSTTTERGDPLFLSSSVEHNRRLGRIERAIDYVRKIIDGKLPRDEQIPWNDPEFQEAVLNYLRVQAPKFEAASAKLAVIKEVFGGAK